MSQGTPSEFARALKAPAAIVVLGILLVVGIGLNSIVFGGGIKFQKQRVELQKDLTLLPKKLGPWLQVLDDQNFPAEQVHELGTTMYIARGYIDTRRINDPKLLSGLEKLSSGERANLFFTIQHRDPKSAIYIHMAYYTGLVDTVAHVPERCMVGGGFDPVNPTRVQLALGNGVPPVDVKYIDFVKREGGKGSSVDVTTNVAYFFQVNGDYEWDSITGVRYKLQNLWEKYGYYCKIEMSTSNLTPTEAQASMADFVTNALPEMEKLLPDWDAVNGRPSKSKRSPATMPVAVK